MTESDLYLNQITFDAANAESFVTWSQGSEGSENAPGATINLGKIIPLPSLDTLADEHHDADLTELMQLRAKLRKAAWGVFGVTIPATIIQGYLSFSIVTDMVDHRLAQAIHAITRGKVSVSVFKREKVEIAGDNPHGIWAIQPEHAWSSSTAK